MVIEQGREVIRVEAEAVRRLEERIGEEFARAVELILATSGRVVVTGVGKSGLIARKIAATLTSTGTPAAFLHPAEGVHGDLGLVMRGDTVLVVSKSGETEEIQQQLALFKRLTLPIIALTGNPRSLLAKLSDVVLDVSVEQEACPHDLTPTASTTAALAMGDALAIAVLVQRGFRPEDFALLHPGGQLGKRLLLRVREVMVAGDEVPRVPESATMREAVLEMMAKRGITAVVDGDHRVRGVITNGDLVRLMKQTDQIFQIPVTEVMNYHPKIVNPDVLAITAVNLMESYGIMALLVVDEEEALVGVVHLHDLMRAGVV